nr:hypothetical protein [Nitratidesulfovibrio sp. HK-II]
MTDRKGHAAPPSVALPDQSAHGGEVYRVARELGVAPEDILDCGSNGFAHAVDLTRALVEAQPHPFEHYPDPDSTALRQRLAAHEGVSPGQLLVGNGSSELIWLALRVLRPTRVTLLGPTFSEYVRACETHAIPWRVLHGDPARALDAPPPDRPPHRARAGGNSPCSVRPATRAPFPRRTCQHWWARWHGRATARCWRT